MVSEGDSRTKLVVGAPDFSYVYAIDWRRRS